MTLDFRLARPQELEDVERILLSAFEPYKRRLGRAATDDTYESLAPALARGDVFVGEQAGLPVGVVVIGRQPAEWDIESVAVDPGRQGQGLGSWLLDRIEAEALSNDVQALTLHTAEIMDDLLRLYSRRGFVEVRRGPPPHDKDSGLRVYMKKQL